MTTTSTTNNASAVITSTAPTTSTASSAASAVSTNSIDVASIVSQLMSVENKPLDALTSKIASAQTIISDLGILKGKVATLQSTLSTFEDASTYNNPIASTNNSSVVNATASSNAAIGSVDVVVNQLAAASSTVLHATSTVSGGVTAYIDFTAADAPTSVDGTHPFTLTVGSGTPYSTATNPITGSGAGGVVTLTDLKNWINALGVNVSANIVQTSSSSNWVLQVNGTQTGSANTITLGGTGLGLSTNLEPVATAQDAKAVIGGLAVTRSSNAISDVINGITFNLVGKSVGGSSTSIAVAQGADNSSAMINTLISAYNDVINQYNTMTANSNNSAKPGNFANDPGMVSFVNNIKSMFANGATESSSVSATGFSASTDTINIDKNSGYLQVGSMQYQFKSITQATPTVSDFVSWINSLNAGVAANFDGSSITVKTTNSNSNTSVDLSGLTTNKLKRTTVSLATMGMDIQLDGTMQFNTASYQSAVANNLYGKLAQGLKMGYTNTTSNLDKFLVSELDSTSGALVNQITNENNAVLEMQKKETDLQARLNGIQASYVTQYSALNTLLFQLNSTSTSLASALAAVTNINAGK